MAKLLKIQTSLSLQVSYFVKSWYRIKLNKPEAEIIMIFLEERE